MVDCGTDDVSGRQLGDMSASSVDLAGGGLVAHNHKRMWLCRSLAREERQQRVTGFPVRAARPRRLTTVMMNHDAAQPVTLSAVKHLNVEIWMPGHAVTSPSDSVLFRNRAPLACEQYQSVAGVHRAAQKVTRPLLVLGDVGVKRDVQVARDAELSVDH